MRILFLVFFVIGQLQNVAGQKNKERSGPLIPEGDLNCFYKNKYSPARRSRFYPFDIADTIKLVSFRYHKAFCPVKKDTLVIDSLIEMKTLTKVETDKLTDILYNNFYKQQPNYGSMALCFSPRNAILFFDKSGNIEEYLLICFQCDRYEASSDKIRIGDECLQKMEKLSQLFVSAGLTFGTDNSIPGPYSGESYDDDIIAPSIKTDGK